MKYTSDFNDNNNLSKDIVANSLQKYTDCSDFFKYYKEANVPLNYKQLIYNCNNNINENIIN